MNPAHQNDPTRNMIVRMIVGAVVGASVTLLFLAFVVEAWLRLDDPAAMIAIGAGLRLSS